eukprot:7240546-Pyramimonas_sp.AAC.1
MGSFGGFHMTAVGGGRKTSATERDGREVQDARHGARAPSLSSSSPPSSSCSSSPRLPAPLL